MWPFLPFHSAYFGTAQYYSVLFIRSSMLSPLSLLLFRLSGRVERRLSSIAIDRSLSIVTPGTPPQLSRRGWRWWWRCRWRWRWQADLLHTLRWCARPLVSPSWLALSTRPLLERADLTTDVCIESLAQLWYRPDFVGIALNICLMTTVLYLDRCCCVPPISFVYLPWYHTYSECYQAIQLIVSRPYIIPVRF